MIGALLLSFNVLWNDSQLPRLSWLVSDQTADGVSVLESSSNKSNSAFVIAAVNSAVSGHNGLAAFINSCILVTGLTTANTTLYIASRTLFSLTERIKATPSSPLILRTLSYFGQTNRRRVPMRAVLASCFFCWVPFLYLSKSNEPGTTISAVSRHEIFHHIQSSDVGFLPPSYLRY